MPGRRKQKSFQIVHKTASSWEKALLECKKTNSLIIADIHASWCGNCKAITETFRRIYLENSEKYPIKFHVVDAEAVLKEIEGKETDGNFDGVDDDDDTRRDNWIEALKPIAGKSQPHFLFYLSGVKRKQIVGVNTPIIEKTVQRLLKDIDEGKNTGKEYELNAEEGEFEFGGTPQLKMKENEVANDDKFFSDTTVTTPLPSTRSEADKPEEGKPEPGKEDAKTEEAKTEEKNEANTGGNEASDKKEEAPKDGEKTEEAKPEEKKEETKPEEKKEEAKPEEKKEEAKPEEKKEETKPEEKKEEPPKGKPMKPLVGKSLALFPKCNEKCLNVAGGGKDKGVLIVCWDNPTHEDSAFEFVAHKEHFHIKNPKNGLFVNIPGGTDKNGTKIHLWDNPVACGADSEFTLESYDDSGYFSIINVKTKKCLTVDGGKKENGAHIVLGDEPGTTNSLFKWVESDQVEKK